MIKYILYLIKCCLITLGIFAMLYTVLSFFAFTFNPFSYGIHVKVLYIVFASILSFAFCIASYLDDIGK